MTSCMDTSQCKPGGEVEKLEVEVDVYAGVSYPSLATSNPSNSCSSRNDAASESSVTDEGNNASSATFIAASQRPDGTWRKPRRVKEGYVPQEEVPLYESKGKQFAKSKPLYPPGVTPEMVAESKARREKAEKAEKAKSHIPGLIINSSTETKTSKKKKKKKGGASHTVDSLSEGLAQTQINQQETKPVTKQSKQAAASSNPAAPDTQTDAQGTAGVADPTKRVKNLRKRLREIEAIEQKIASGELKTPEKDQLEKVARKKEVQSEIERLLPLISAA